MNVRGELAELGDRDDRSQAAAEGGPAAVRFQRGVSLGEVQDPAR